MAFILSASMSLPIPVVGQEPGPNYAQDVNNSLTLIDQHDHSPGKGVQITPSGLNINATLSVQNQLITNIQADVFFLQSVQPTTSNSLYVFPGGESPARPDLWYYDGTTQIQITKAGTLNTVAASIPGESYSGGTFFWKQGSGSTVPANFDIGSITLRPNVSNTTNGTIISGATSGSFSLTLPNASVSLLPSGLPGSNVLATVDAAGNISTLAAGTPGQELISQGTAGPPVWTTIVPPVAPTIQQFTATSYYTFTVVALTVQTDAGAVYNNNGQAFTVLYTASIGATTLVTAASGAPTSSGSLVLFTGTGQSTIVFSAETSGISYQLPSGPAPLYIVVEGVGGGGGGGSGNSGGPGSAGGSTTFGSGASLYTANGGSGGGNAGGLGGAGGTATTTVPILPSPVIVITGGSGSGGGDSVGDSTPSGGPGGNNPLGGGGGGGQANGPGLAGATNTGGGGGGGGGAGTNPSAAGGGAGGYFKAFISSPASSYPIVVGAGGAPGTPSGETGAAGGSGVIIVTEYYQ